MPHHFSHACQAHALTEPGHGQLAGVIDHRTLHALTLCKRYRHAVTFDRNDGHPHVRCQQPSRVDPCGEHKGISLPALGLGTDRTKALTTGIEFERLHASVGLKMQTPRLIPRQEPLRKAFAIATGIVAHMQASGDAHRFRQARLHGTYLTGLIPLGVTTEGLQLLKTFLHDGRRR